MCVGCPRNTFSAATGISSAAGCLSCSVVGDHRLTLGEGTNARGGCVCAAGFVDVDGECVACFRGENCTADGLVLQSLPLYPGFWRSSADSRDMRECRLTGVCRGGTVAAGHVAGAVAADATCLVHHRGPLCEVRASGPCLSCLLVVPLARHSTLSC
jgi:hypothetical protein